MTVRPDGNHDERVGMASAEAGVEWAIPASPRPQRVRAMPEPTLRDRHVHRRITWKVILVCLVLAGLTTWGLSAWSEALDDKYPYHRPPALPTPPNVLRTPAQMLQWGSWTPQEYREALAGHVRRHDHNCVEGIDTSAGHAGDLCLP